MSFLSEWHVFPTEHCTQSKLQKRSEDPSSAHTHTTYHILSCSSNHGLLLHLFAAPFTLLTGWYAALNKHLRTMRRHAAPTNMRAPVPFLSHRHVAPTSRTCVADPYGTFTSYFIMSTSVVFF